MANTSTTPAAEGIKVGDFFVASWGYEQTNIDFYKVVGLTPKGVKIQAWQSAQIDGKGSPYQDAVIPGDGARTVRDHSACTSGMDFWERQAAVVERPAPVETKRLNTAGGWKASVKINSFAWAYKWDGSTQYATAVGFGH